MARVKPAPLCGGKRRYPSEDVAWGVAARRAGKTTRSLRVYACPSCNGWHLTKMVAR